MKASCGWCYGEFEYVKKGVGRKRMYCSQRCKNRKANSLPRKPDSEADQYWIVCEVCGQRTIGRSANQKACSGECQLQANRVRSTKRYRELHPMRAPLVLNCGTCGMPSGTRVYCSSHCQPPSMTTCKDCGAPVLRQSKRRMAVGGRCKACSGNGPQKLRPCLHCGAMFKKDGHARQHYCSVSCRGRAHRRKRSSREQRLCLGCNSSFATLPSSEQRYCLAACRSAHRIASQPERLERQRRKGRERYYANPLTSMKHEIARKIGMPAKEVPLETIKLGALIRDTRRTLRKLRRAK